MSKWYDPAELEDFLGSLPKFRVKLQLASEYKNRQEKVPKELRYMILIQKLYLQKKVLLRRNEWMKGELKSIFSEKIQLESEFKTLEKLLKETRNENANLICG
ncbi:LIC_10907 family protein [Leptospira noguchii]|uniref:Uncharacterized protein n=1 Tax=Leptospira noguchii serovar Panama str. CZ214 TaxID=1001595 RepID=T0FVN7_9LEPT|nr:hypothetical protein [Leptospira noguchii]EQA73610.1 hypothetical protein LEP1GSC059_2529 [Leptospira noguchii serovar Panama str. CZ214]